MVSTIGHIVTTQAVAAGGWDVAMASLPYIGSAIVGLSVAWATHWWSARKDETKLKFEFPGRLLGLVSVVEEEMGARRIETCFSMTMTGFLSWVTEEMRTSQTLDELDMLKQKSDEFKRDRDTAYHRRREAETRSARGIADLYAALTEARRFYQCKRDVVELIKAALQSIHRELATDPKIRLLKDRPEDPEGLNAWLEQKQRDEVDRIKKKIVNPVNAVIDLIGGLDGWYLSDDASGK